MARKSLRYRDQKKQKQPKNEKKLLEAGCSIISSTFSRKYVGIFLKRKEKWLKVK